MIFRNLRPKGSKWMSVSEIFQYGWISTYYSQNIAQMLYSNSEFHIKFEKKMFRKLHKKFFWDLRTKIQIFFDLTKEIDCNARFFTATFTKILARKIRKQCHSSSRISFFMKKRSFVRNWRLWGHEKLKMNKNTISIPFQ